jgi:hypothetical protein
MLAAALAVSLALAGLLLSLWPALGLSLLGASTLLLVVGVASARAARRAHLARGERGWGALAAYAVHALSVLVVSVCLLGGSALAALVTLGPPLSPRREPSALESRAPELLAVAGLVGVAYVAYALGDDGDANASTAAASASGAAPSPRGAAASAPGATASAPDAAESPRSEGFPFGAVLLGALGVVGVGEYLWEHREEVAWLAGIVGIAALAVALDDRPGTAAPPATSGPASGVAP